MGRRRLPPGDVTDQDVDATEFTHGVGDELIAEVLIAQIARQGDRLATSLPDELGDIIGVGLLRRQESECDIGAFAGKRQAGPRQQLSIEHARYANIYLNYCCLRDRESHARDIHARGTSRGGCGETVTQVKTMCSLVAQAQSDAEYFAARALFAEYAATLGVDLSFQGFASELNALESMYGSPSGCLLLARNDGEFVGCIGVRRWSADSCEMKRLYVRDVARGSGIGRALALAAISRAKSIGYKRMLLDTLAGMSAARRMYAALGFRACEPYCHNPIPGTMFMELILGEGPALQP